MNEFAIRRSAHFLLAIAAAVLLGGAARVMPPEQEDIEPVDKNAEAANKLFPCPTAKWDVVKQPFWRHHAVLRLRSCQGPHRPTVGVDKQGIAHLLTDGVQRISEGSILNSFNAMAKGESVKIKANNAQDYLRFFITLILTGVTDYILVTVAWRRK
jgi:hypothetical protein